MNHGMKLKEKDKRSIREAFGLFVHISLTMTICVVGCLLIGKVLDDKLGTSPWLLFVFIILGVSSAIYSLYKIASKH